MMISTQTLVAFTTLVVSTAALNPTLSIHGSGTTNPSKCYWHIMDKIEARSKLPMHMTYRGIGSSSGQAEFVVQPPITAFGSGDIPLTQERWQTVEGDVIQLPVFVGAVSLFHNLPNVPTLNLTGCTVAKIFQRKITNWGDDEIKAENPNLILPGGGMEIRVARRVDGSSSTSGTTNYLANACPSEWPADNTGSSVEWADGTLECQGSGGVVDCMNEAPGTIGYLDSGHGHAEGFEEVYLQNTYGTKLTTIESSARGGIAAAADVEGLLPPDAYSDFSSVSLINQPGEFTWPIALMTYVYVRRDLSFIENAQEQALLKAFLQALYDPEYAQQCVDAYSFTMVDGGARQLALDAIESLNINASATPFTFEEDTMLVDGHGDYVISAKRSSAAEVEFDSLGVAVDDATSDIQELQRLMAQTQLELSRLQDQMNALTGGGSAETATTTSTGDDEEPSVALASNEAAASSLRADDKKHEDDQDGQIVAALAISSIALILSVVILAMLLFRGVAGSHQDPSKQNGHADTAVHDI